MPKHPKKTWKDRLVQFPNRFKDQNNNQLTLTPDPGTITEVGTPISAANLNALEAAAENANNELPPVAVTLKHGLQVVTTEQKGPFNVVVKGRTLVNLLGNDGNFEKDTDGNGVADGWVKGSANPIYSVVSTNVTYGTKAQKIESLSGDSSQTTRTVTKNVSLTANKYYVFVVDVVTDGTSRAEANFGGGANIGRNTSGVLYKRYNPTSDTTTTVYINNFNAVGVVGWVEYDGAGVYEVDSALYNAIGTTITESNIREYLPHVDGIQHVQNPAITVVSDNLIKPFTSSDWTIHANAEIVGPYELKISGTSSFQMAILPLFLPTGTTVTFKMDGTMPANQKVRVRYTDNTADYFAIGTTRTVTKDVAFFELGCDAVGTFTFKLPHLVLGSSAPTQFLPYNESYAYGVTDSAGKPLKLAGDPKTGVYDVLFQQGAEWRKLKFWEMLDLDGNITWAFGSDAAGYKTVQYWVNGNLNPLAWKDTAPILISKYDGKILARNATPNAADQFHTGSANTGDLYITIADTDSGFTESLNPNSNAIKALMNGWKANGNNGSVYNSWVSILDGSAPTTNTEAYVAANKAPGWTGWATLTYQLADEKTEVVTVEGIPMLGSGGNHVTVGEAVIVREKAKPFESTTVYVVNESSQSASYLKNRSSKILSVYKNGSLDGLWKSTTNDASARGGSKAFIPKADFDTTAEYTFTYIALDKYAMSANVVDVTGEYWNNVGSVAAKNAEAVPWLRAAIDSLKAFALSQIAAVKTLVSTAQSTADAAKATADAALPKSGGTLTNALTIQQASGSAQLKLERTGTSPSVAYLGTNGGQLVYFDSTLTNQGTVWNSGNDGSGSGLDADMFDGADSNVFVRDRASITSGDYNTFTTPGTYQIIGPVSNFSNAPLPATSHPYGLLMVLVGNGNVVTQIYYPHNENGTPIFRIRYDGTWIAWKTMDSGAKIIPILSQGAMVQSVSATPGNTAVSIHAGSTATGDTLNYKFLWQAALAAGKSVYFECDMNAGAGSTGYAALAKLSDGSLVGQVSLAGGSSTSRVRSSAIALTDNAEYVVSIWNSAGSPGTQIYTARLIII